MRKIILAACIIVLAIFTVSTANSRVNNKLEININKNNVKYSVKFKGLKGARSFKEDESGNYYIAFKNRVQCINKNGKSYDIIKDNSYNIKSIEYFENKIYYVSNSSIYSYDIINKSKKVLIKDIPNFGDYKDVIIKILDKKLYVSIGAATNSGVVGKDNVWLKENPFGYDMSPAAFTLKGINFGKDKNTGAFTPYNTTNFKGQIIAKHYPGNSSIVVYDLTSGKSSTYAYGIRNVSGMDFNSGGKLIAAVGGMEDRGFRPVKGDNDYIYKIEKGKWYGFPDYSGGDPITSPKFTTEKGKNLNFIIDNQPTTNPPAPIYQNKDVSSIKNLAVDRDAKIGKKNCIYFYDKSAGAICFFNEDRARGKVLTFKNKIDISDLKFSDGELNFLDSNDGYLVSIMDNNIDVNNYKNKTILYILYGGAALGIISILVIEKFKIYKNR
ncbi:MAG: PQQ-dependent sugar dehydrogenase [Clostridium sp.]|nr:PQQ-dependent sugar dehydrogenase [Clostridium sp.]